MKNGTPFPSRIYQFAILIFIGALAACIPIALGINARYETLIILATSFLTVILSTYLINKIKGQNLSDGCSFCLGRKEVKQGFLIILSLIFLHIFILYPIKHLIFGFPKEFACPKLIDLISFIIIAALEEIVFRFILLNGLLNTYKPILAILFTSVLFMLAHDPVMYIPSFIVGFTFGYIFYVTKNISICIILHVLLNAFSSYWGRVTYFQSSILCIILISFGVVFLILLLYYYRHLLKNKYKTLL